MSCGARLPIYALIIPAFFARKWHGPILWLIYIIGIALAIVCAKLLRSTLFKGEAEPFVMELPPYRVPTIRGVLIHMWERGWLYLKKAGTIILAISILLWAMTSYPKKEEFDKDYQELTAQAEASYKAAVKGLDAQLGLAGGLLTRTAQAELDMAGEQENWHEHQAGFEEAEARRDAAIEELKSAPGGDVLERSLGFRSAVLAARDRFQKAVEEGELEEDSPEYAAVATRRDATLGKLRDEDPNVYAAVVRYLDEVKAPFGEALEHIEQGQQSEEMAHSVAGRIGHGLQPILRPLGFDWRIGTALIGAFGAKEVFVAQMGIVYAVGEADEASDSLRDVLRANYTPLVAFCIMLFCLISAPCMATIAVTKRETNSWGWALFQLGGLTVLAYVITLIVYQIGSLFS